MSGTATRPAGEGAPPSALSPAEARRQLEQTVGDLRGRWERTWTAAALAERVAALRAEAGRLEGRVGDRETA